VLHFYKNTFKLFPNSSSIHIIFFLRVQNIYHPYPHPLKKCYFPGMDTVVLSAFKQTFKSTFHFPTIEYSHASTVQSSCIETNQTYSTNLVFILSTAESQFLICMNVNRTSSMQRVIYASDKYDYISSLLWLLKLKQLCVLDMYMIDLPMQCLIYLLIKNLIITYIQYYNIYENEAAVPSSYGNSIFLKSCIHPLQYLL